jgi:NAD+ synthase (glutamine-hydrolysing)
MVMASIRLALAQTNPTVGAISNNLDDCFSWVERATQQGAEIVLFGEMVATGYPIEDLAQRESFVAEVERKVAEFATQLEAAGYGEIRVILGHPAIAPKANGWAIAQNTASILHRGKVTDRYAKHHLPNYSVFDEYRVFVPGDESLTFEVDETRFSVLICEDIWQDGGPVAALRKDHTDVALVLNGSPFEVGKRETRLQLVADLAKEHDCSVAYVNLVGGQDDLVFDGASLVVDARGNLVSQGKSFDTDLLILDVNGKSVGQVSAIESSNDQVSRLNEGSAHHNTEANLREVWQALVIGLRDYVEKNGFKSVILGLSGGIDSAVCAAIAVDALGPQRVFGVSLPSVYSSDHSKSDAFDLASRLGIHIRTEPIEPLVSVGESQLDLSGLAAENLQARVRGVILMALSNAEGHLTLTTGNKTELSVGYSTIYGDSVGGYAPLKDVPKTMVWALAKLRNQLSPENPPIPENSISKPPSAELRPGQLDQDSLPDYDLLDAILALYIDEGLGIEQIIGAGYEPATVERVASLVNRAEWKRRQGAIGPKITSMAFGRDRRLPITNAYLG